MIIKETNEDVDVTINRCTVCKAIVDDVSAHSCKEILDPKLVAHENDIHAIMAALENSEISKDEKIQLLHSYEQAINWIWENRQFPAIQKRFPFNVIQAHVQKRIRWMIDRVRQMEESCYDDYKKMMKDGIPLQERRNRINHVKIEWCKKREVEYLLLLKNFRVRPLRDWLQAGDFESIKRMGFGEFINYNLDYIIHA